MTRTSRFAVLGAALAGLVTPLLIQPAQAAAPVVRRPRRLVRVGHRHPLLHRRRHQLPALHGGLPQPDRRGPRLRAQLPRVLGRDRRRRHQHPALGADLGDELRLDLGRRQRRGLRRRAHRVRAAGLDEQLRRRDQHRPVLHQHHPPVAAGHPLLRHPQPRALRQGRRRRLPADLHGEDCNAFTWFSPAEESRLNQTADLLNSRLAPPRRPPASPSPTRPAASSGTRSATPTSGSTASPTRSARATTPRPPATRAATRPPSARCSPVPPSPSPPR